MQRGEASGSGRRNLLIKGATLLGAAALAPGAPARTRGPSSMVELAQASTSAGAATAAAALTVKSVERLAGSGTSFAYAVKAGPWIFLNGHEAYDFERGLAPEGEGPRGSRLSGRPPPRRRGEHNLRRMRSTRNQIRSRPAD